MTLKMSRLSRGAATMLLAAATAGTALVAVAPAATAQEATAPEGETTCTDAGSVSVLAAYDQIVAESRDSIPEQFAAAYDTNTADLRNALLNTDVAYVDVSRDAHEINDEAVDNEDRYANLAAARLDKIRNGEEDAVVAFQDLSLSEVVETLALGIYTFTVPLDVIAAGMPSIAPIPVIGQAAGGTPLIGGYLTIGYLAKLPFQYGSKGIKAFADGVQADLTSRCWTGDSIPSDEERLSDGGANPVIPVQPAERANAQYMTLDGDTCVPASAETLGAALDRVAEGMRPEIPADKLGTFDAEVARLQGNARTARVTNNFIMKEPEDLNPVLAMLDNPAVTFAWGAVQGAFDGTANETTAVGDLTVGNGVDYATVADYLINLIIGEVWDVATGDIGTEYEVTNLFTGMATGKTFSIVPNLANVAAYFSGQALETYDNVLDTMCLVHPEDAEPGE